MSEIVRQPTHSDHEDWLNLWRQYLVFYEHELTDQQTELTWQRLLSQDGPVYGIVVERDGAVIGFAHYSFTHSTWEEHAAIYVEDLFVDPSVRQSGVAHALAAKLGEIAVNAGVSRLHWMTQSHNVTARKLYDELGTLTEFIVYEKYL
jgi:GNAT superfamily N-acetyltransferase